jgi:AraC family transcriptional regulator
MNPITEHLVRHDLDDTRTLLDLAKGVPSEAYESPQVPGLQVLGFDGPDESLAQLLEHLVATKEIWLAAIHGEDFPAAGDRDPASLLTRHDEVAPRWLGTVRDLDARGAWEDRLVDALCDPPESFVMGSVFAHVVTYAAARRQVARHLLRQHGVEVDEGDPITWLRRQRGEE